MDAADLDYELPGAAIAQHPVEPRDSARLLVDRGRDVEHRSVADLDVLVEPGDIVVVNSTRVIPARLHLRKATGGAVEVLLLERRPEGWWEALVRPGRRVPDGTVLGADGAPDWKVVVGRVLGDGRRRVDLVPGDGTDERHDLIDTVGEVPLPPYIHEPLDDPERYQTVFADLPGSVAAPTAGLHLTTDLLERVRSRGAEVVEVDLRVGLGTFKPITADRVEDHPMHSERYSIPPEAEAVLGPRLDGSGSRVLAVGTTVVRALEAWAETGSPEGDTSIFIRPGHSFRVVDRLLTNFHVPRSSLLALVEAFVGPRWRNLYRIALDDGYRFLSFGDAMLLERTPEPPEGPR